MIEALTLDEPPVIHPGDLFRAEFCGTIYFGLVLEFADNTVCAELGNGVVAQFPPSEIELVPLHFLSSSTTNFLEAMKAPSDPCKPRPRRELGIIATHLKMAYLGLMDALNTEPENIALSQIMLAGRLVQLIMDGASADKLHAEIRAYPRGT